ncbi:MAG TPA: hypothetical protein EYG69_05355 [Campylobacterales bacterium]|nr:hypothetical protein [Campylobacterales bacterium]
MLLSNLKLKPREFIKYKFFNSLFLGLSVGSIFTIYSPLNPSIYSIGGILLAIGMTVVAKFYEKILNIEYFFKISLAVEFIILFIVLFYLFKPFEYMTALLIYTGYQLTFMFGSYLLRAETLLLRKNKLLSLVDISKQLGNLSGMLISFLFYKVINQFFTITTNSDKVYAVHFILLLTELIIIYFISRSFITPNKNKRDKNKS